MIIDYFAHIPISTSNTLFVKYWHLERQLGKLDIGSDIRKFLYYFFYA